MLTIEKIHAFAQCGRGVLSYDPALLCELVKRTFNYRQERSGNIREIAPMRWPIAEEGCPKLNPLQTAARYTDARETINDPRDVAVTFEDARSWFMKFVGQVMDGEEPASIHLAEGEFFS